jgi:hypothetical protein
LEINVDLTPINLHRLNLFVTVAIYIKNGFDTCTNLLSGKVVCRKADEAPSSKHPKSNPLLEAGFFMA